jgi:hypothetical protein
MWQFVEKLLEISVRLRCQTQVSDSCVRLRCQTQVSDSGGTKLTAVGIDINLITLAILIDLDVQQTSFILWPVHL